MIKSVKSCMFQIWPNLGPWDPWNHLGPHPMATRGVKKFFFPKLCHLGSLGTNFGDKICEKSNFQKLAHFWSILTHLGCPTGHPWVQMSFWWLNISNCIRPNPNQARNMPKRLFFTFLYPSSVILGNCAVAEAYIFKYQFKRPIPLAKNCIET